MYANVELPQFSRQLTRTGRSRAARSFSNYTLFTMTSPVESPSGSATPDDLDKLDQTAPENLPMEPTPTSRVQTGAEVLESDPRDPSHASQTPMLSKRAFPSVTRSPSPSASHRSIPRLPAVKLNQVKAAVRGRKASTSGRGSGYTQKETDSLPELLEQYLPP